MGESDYRAYMLRLWCEDESLPWRASLEDPHTGERFSFASLERAVAFIEAQINTPPPGAEVQEDEQLK